MKELKEAAKKALRDNGEGDIVGDPSASTKNHKRRD